MPKTKPKPKQSRFNCKMFEKGKSMKKLSSDTVCAVINGGNKVDHRMRNNATFQEQKKLELEFCSSEFATNLKIIQGGNCQQNFTMVWSTVGEEWQRMNEEEARGSANDKTQKKTQQAWL